MFIYSCPESEHDFMVQMHKKNGEDDTSEAKAKSSLTKLIQGGIVFIVMFAVLYVTLRRLTSNETA